LPSSRGMVAVSESVEDIRKQLVREIASWDGMVQWCNELMDTYPWDAEYHRKSLNKATGARDALVTFYERVFADASGE